MPWETKKLAIEDKITITDEQSEKYKNYVQCRWIKVKNYVTK